MSEIIVFRRRREDRGRDNSFEVDSILDLMVEACELLGEAKVLLEEIKEAVKPGP